jgi:hypothetical protein
LTLGRLLSGSPVGVELWRKDPWLELGWPVYRPRVTHILSHHLQANNRTPQHAHPDLQQP